MRNEGDVLGQRCEVELDVGDDEDARRGGEDEGSCGNGSGGY